jgi:hypothetical protein
MPTTRTVAGKSMRRVLPPPAARMAAVLLACVAFACREREQPPPPASTTAAKPGGSCRQTPVAGQCRFQSVRVTGTEPGGGVRYYVAYDFDEPGHDEAERRTIIRVVAAATDRDALESHYRSQDPVMCNGVRVWPPCAPGVVVSPQVAPPPVGRVLGALDP